MEGSLTTPRTAMLTPTMTGRRPKDDRKTATDPRVLEAIQELGRIGGKTRANVYEDRVSGWLLRPIRTLLETRDSHFAALSLALSYFEGWAQYRYGEDSRGQGRELFMRAVKHVVPVVERHVPDRGDDLATELAMLYDEARCGASISISAQRATLEISAFVIDPAAFVDDIEYTSSDMLRDSAIQRMPIFVTTPRERGSVSTSAVRFMYRLASRLASVHPAA